MTAETTPITLDSIDSAQQPAYYEEALIAATISTLIAVESQRNFHYYGERGDWLIVAAMSDYSDTVTRSNFAVLAERLIGLYPDSAAIEHWGNDLYKGGSDALLVQPGSDAAQMAAAAILYQAECYPVLSDDHLSDLEYEEAPRCERCNEVFYLPSGEYAYNLDNSKCERCMFLERLTIATYHPTPISHFDRRYFRRTLRRLRGVGDTFRVIADHYPNVPNRIGKRSAA